MKRYFLVVVGVFLVLAIVSMSSEAQAGSDEQKAAIDKVRDMEEASVNNADSSNISNIYSMDVEYIPPGEPTLKGTDAVRDWHTALIEQFDAHLEYTSSDIKVMGDWAVEQYVGTVTMKPKAGGDQMVEQVRGIHVYRRGEDGAWKITTDIWNYHAP